MLVRRADVIPVECVARGYLSGSGWKQYRGRAVGLRRRAARRTGRIRPAARADLHADHEGRRRPRPAADARRDARPGRRRARRAAEGADAHDLRAGRGDRAASAGIILADTKFEFGFCDGELILIDEVLHAGLVALLARRRVRAGRTAAVVRQAVRPRLAGRERLGPRAAGRRRCPPTSSRRRPAGTGRPTSG